MLNFSAKLKESETHLSIAFNPGADSSWMILSEQVVILWT